MSETAAAPAITSAATPTNTQSSPAPAASAATTNKVGDTAKKVGDTENRKAATPTVGDQVAKPAEGEAPKPPEKRKYKLKVDKGEQELELTDDEITMRLQKGMGAEKRMSEAAQIRKAFADFQKAVKEDPIAALKDPAFGVDVLAMAEERLAKEYERMVEDSRLTPEQKAMKEVEAHQKQIEAERDAARKALNDRIQAETEERVLYETRDLFTKALSEAGLPDTPEVMYEMAALGKLSLEHGLDLTPKQFAEEVKQRLNEGRDRLHQSFQSTLKGDALLDHLGDDLVKETVRAYLARQKAPISQPPTPPAQKDTEKAGEPRKHMTPSAFRKKHLFGLG